VGIRILGVTLGLISVSVQAEATGIIADHGAMALVMVIILGDHMVPLDIFMDTHTTQEQDTIVIILTGVNLMCLIV